MGTKEHIASIGATPAPHLSDDRLMEIYVVSAEDRHLDACRTCRARYDDVVQALDQVREDVVREADHVFTAERLHEQRDRIMRRLERHGHPAEVVMFPTRAATHPAMRVFGPARRWIAGAAAAGLAAGVFLGFAMDRRTHYMALQQNMALQQTLQPSASAAAAAWQAEVRDDQFFIEIDDALMGSRALELRAIDAMTTPVEIREASYPR
jgi:hypothetical protein